MAGNDVIISVRDLEPRRKIPGMPTGHRRAPKIRGGTDLYLETLNRDDSYEWRPITTKDHLQNAARMTDGTRFYDVRLEDHSLTLDFPEIATDKQGHKCDAHIEGKFSIIDSLSCLEALATIARSNGHIKHNAMQSWIARQITPMLHDVLQEELHKWSIAQILEKRVLPFSWWQKHLADWLAHFGVGVSVVDFSLSSAEADVAEAERERRRDLDRREEAGRKEQEAERNRVRRDLDHENQLKQTRHDSRLSDEQRDHEVRMLQLDHQATVKQAENRLEKTRRKETEEAAKHESKMTRLQAVEDPKESAPGKSGHNDKILMKLDEIGAQLTPTAISNAQLDDGRRPHAAAEKMVSPEFGISPAILAGLEDRVDPQRLCDDLRRRADTDGHKVTVRKVDLATRDIGTLKVPCLRINESLQFEFTTTQEGYVTILNIGTSGRVSVHVPNAYVMPEQARVDGGHSYEIPGDEFLPTERLKQLNLDYLESGPGGWEHIAVLVSDEPLISERTLGRTEPGSPLMELRTTEGFSEVIDLQEKLNNASPDSWTAGVLSFLVEKRA